MRELLVVLVWCLVVGQLAAITCYSCESYRDYRCLDPFDFQPFVQVSIILHKIIIFVIF
jgi:hypothetical protein